MKLNWTRPGCGGRECYVDNRSALVNRKACGRVLFPGERYCIFGPKVRKFKKSDAQIYVPGWCPKRNKNPIIRVYKISPDPLDLLFKNQFCENRVSPVDACRYILHFTTQTAYTPNQFAKVLTSGFCDFMDLLGYYPDIRDIIEIDDGLNPVYMRMDKDYLWAQQYGFDKTKCADGSIGGYIVAPYDEQYADRFSHATEEYADNCVGYMLGYFAEGQFRSHWQENRADLAAPNMWNEFEAALNTLKTKGFLRTSDDMWQYCRKFMQGAFPEKYHEYGYAMETKSHRLCIRCLPDGEIYNVFIYVYRNN